MSSIFRALKQGIRCLLGRHQYHPMYETKVIGRDSHHIRILAHRYSCCHCGALTAWMSIEQKRQFDLQHQPDWIH